MKTIKNIIATFTLLLITQVGFSQFQFGEIYMAKAVDGAAKYFRIYDDGLVLMVATKDELSKVKEYFQRDSEEADYIVLYRSQCKIKDGKKATFVIENDGAKINCIAQGQGDKVSLMMLSPGVGKQQIEYTLVK